MKQVSGIDELNNFITENLNNVTVLYFGAEWCPPCKILKEKLKEEDTYTIMPKLAVCYLDADDKNNKKIFKRYKVEAFPTQVFIKLDSNNHVNELTRIEGYDFNRLKQNYDTYSNL